MGFLDNTVVPTDSAVIIPEATLYEAVTEITKTTKHRISVSEVLKKLGVSISGYKAWKKRGSSETEVHRNRIYNAYYQNYGAPKITEQLRKNVQVISERIVGKYMHQLGIKAQWIKSRTLKTLIQISAVLLKIFSMSSLSLKYPML